MKRSLVLTLLLAFGFLFSTKEIESVSPKQFCYMLCILSCLEIAYNKDVFAFPRFIRLLASLTFIQEELLQNKDNIIQNL